MQAHTDTRHPKEVASEGPTHCLVAKQALSLPLLHIFVFIIFSACCDRRQNGLHDQAPEISLPLGRSRSMRAQINSWVRWDCAVSDGKKVFFQYDINLQKLQYIILSIASSGTYNLLQGPWEFRHKVHSASSICPVGPDNSTRFLLCPGRCNFPYQKESKSPDFLEGIFSVLFWHA